ncbi:MAG: 2-succinyl-5-enolpyruvyl-6-hydroxy-3-cyclohexene-1-carboxylic-acid synthase, partial [Microbacteriaceae bacterium]
MPSVNPASVFSAALLGAFIRLGVRDVVLSPGSRSQALALAAAEFERAGLIRLRVRIDERVAGFLALGLAVEARTPVVVITTSGTAVANLHPAVLEAHHGGVPLILLTADRPEELRGIGSNQTTVQAGLFGSAVAFVREVDAPPHDPSAAAQEFPERLAAESYAAASGRSGAPGPVQLNLAFREPLSGPVPPSALAAAGVVRAPIGQPPGRGPLIELTASRHTVVVAGHGAGEQAEAVARALGAPLLAEVSSGARFGPNVVAAYRQLLGNPDFGGRVERVIVFGHPTLSREVPALIQRKGVETVVVRGCSGEDYNPGHRVAEFAGSVTVTGEAEEDRSWLGGWVSASRRLLEQEPPGDPAEARTDDREAVAHFAREQLAVFRQPVTRRMLVEAVWRASWPHDRLVFAASRLIREADRVVPGKKIAVHANRGLAGIDGTIATAMGIALASQAADVPDNAGRPAGINGTTRVVLGDLALLHDVGSLLIGDGELRPRMQLIVGNDGGGSIFDGLEVAADASTDAFDRVLYTPHRVRFEELAAGYGWEYRRVANRGELDEALVC